MAEAEGKPTVKRGGARPGSGRKPVPLKERRLQRSYYLNEEEFKKVNAFIEQMRSGNA